MKSKHYDVLKFYTTILVVLAHASRMYTSVGAIPTALKSGFLDQFTQIIYSFHMPLYFAISGMIYGLCINDLGKYTDTKKFILKKTTRLLIPYLFFGICVVAPVMYFLHITSGTYFSYCINGIILARDSRHLWFIIVLFEIYVICALFNKKIQAYPYVLFAGLLILALFRSKIPNIYEISSLCYYSIFFFLGFFYNRYYETVNKFITSKIAVLCLAVIFAFLYCYRSFFLFSKALPFVGSICVTAATTYVADSGKNRFIKQANKNGFGIFLFHPMIIYVLYYILGGKNIHPLLLWAGISCVAYFASWGLTVLFRKMHLGVLIGE